VRALSVQKASVEGVLLKRGDVFDGRKSGTGRHLDQEAENVVKREIKKHHVKPAQDATVGEK